MHSGNVSRRSTSCSLRISRFIKPVSFVRLLEDGSLIGIQQSETMSRRVGHLYVEQQQPWPTGEMNLGQPLSHRVGHVQRSLECRVPLHVCAVVSQTGVP